MWSGSQQILACPPNSIINSSPLRFRLRSRLAGELIFVGPLVVGQKRLDHLLHAQVRNQLIGGQRVPGDRIEVADSVQMFDDVGFGVGDAAARIPERENKIRADLPREHTHSSKERPLPWRNHRILHDLETYLSTQVVRYVSLLFTAKEES